MNTVTLAEAKAYLRIGSATAMDSIVTLLVESAETWIEEFCGIGFDERTIQDAIDGGGVFLLPTRRPVRGIVSIVDRDDTTNLLIDGTDYYTLNHALVKYSGSSGWFYGPVPGMWTGRLADLMARWTKGQGRWLLTYASGYTSNSTASTTTNGADSYPHYAIPAPLKMAVLQLARRIYDNRGGVSSESAAGWSVNWTEIEKSDLMHFLSPYQRLDL